MNAIRPGNSANIYMRSMATREAATEVSKALPEAIAACRMFIIFVAPYSGHER